MAVKPRSPMKIAALLYAIAFLVTLVLAYTGNLPPQLQQIPYHDKIGHVILYGVATYLGHTLLGYRRLRNGFPIFPIVFAIFTIVEESFQGLSPNRSLDSIDLIASLFGIALGYQLAEKGQKKHP
jgi:polysaccharide biosynthesis protein VpsQ